MKDISALGRPILFGAVFSIVLFAATVLPGHAFAQVASVQTAQLIPPGQNYCPAVSVTSVEPHVYNGQLQSFDVTVSDVSYIGVFAQVGNSPVSMDFITRWAGSPNGTRIHVDTMDVPVGSGLPVNLTLLSSLPGQPTCITEVAFNATNSGVSTYVPPTGTQSTGTTPTGSQPSSTAGEGSMGAGAKPVTTGSSVSSSTATSTGALTGALTGSGLSLGSVCAGSNAYRLWFILLAIYIVIVAVVVFAEPWFLKDTVVGPTAAILVPLILLLLFWYFSAACRAASWIPVLACVIAIAGLFLAFRDYETMPLLVAPSEKK